MNNMSTARGDSAIVIDRLSVNADAQDLSDLASIQSELAIAFKLLASGVRESDTGFLISAYKPEDFRTFIERGGSLLCARQNHGSRPIGYLLANSGETFLENHPSTQIFWDNKQSESQHGRVYSFGSFTYLDQIGVALALHGLGIARQLHRHFLESAERPILAAVVQEPLRNARSTAFFMKLGYRQIGTFYTAELKGLRDVRSAVLALPADEPVP
jgi:ribosomal protein S18 acetylase RimI-like enzyme